MPDNKIEEDYLNDLLNSLMTDEEGDKEPTVDYVEEPVEEVVMENEEDGFLNGFNEDLLKDIFEEPTYTEESSIEIEEESFMINDDLTIDNELEEEVEAHEQDSEIITDTLEKSKKPNIFTGLFNKIFSKKTKENSDKIDENENEKIIKEINKEQDKVKNKIKKKKEKKEKKPKENKKNKEAKPKKIKSIDLEKDEVIKVSFKGILMVLTIIIVLILIVYLGGDIFYKSQKENRAIDFYQNKNYKAAFNEISGLEIEDDQFYKQLRIIMYVNKDYDIYVTLKSADENAEALDYLIRGIANYDEYKETATELGVLEDLDYVLSLITNKLDEDYDLTVSEARDLTKIKNSQEYSRQINEIANN